MEGSFDLGWMIDKVFETPTGAAVSASPLAALPHRRPLHVRRQRKKWKPLALRTGFGSSETMKEGQGVHRR